VGLSRPVMGLLTIEKELSHSVTACSSVLLKITTVSQPFRMFPAFYWARKFVNIFT
jgi:hypothetical protein